MADSKAHIIEILYKVILNAGEIYWNLIEKKELLTIFKESKNLADNYFRR